MESGLEQIIEQAKKMKKTARIGNTPYFFKSSSDRRILKRRGHKTTLEDEYAALERLYAASPENVARPIALVKDSSGRAKGYLLEFLEGKQLNRTSIVPKETYNDLKSTLKRFSDLGIAHGDIYTANMFLMPNGKIKLIDPAGLPENYRWKSDEIELDSVRSNIIMKTKVTPEELSAGRGSTAIRRSFYSCVSHLWGNGIDGEPIDRLYLAYSKSRLQQIFANVTKQFEKYFR